MENINEKVIERLKALQEVSISNKRKVAALIYCVDTGNIISEAINYNPCNNEKCENSEGETYDTVIHAEEACIMNLLSSEYSRRNEKLVLYCTFSPCINCCRLIAQAKISMVYYINEHKINFQISETKGSLSPLQYLYSNHIGVFKYNEDLKLFMPRELNAIIYHSADIDGLMSGYLMRQIQPNSIMIPYNYENETDWMKENYSKYTFVDITPPLSWIESKKDDILNDTIQITIIDHHLDKLFNIEECEKILGINKKILIIKNKPEEKISAVGLIKEIKNIQQWTKNLYYEFEELLQIISDYDSWKFVTYEQSRKLRIYNIINYMSSTIKTIEDLDLFVLEFLEANITLESLEEYGKVLYNSTHTENKQKLNASKHCLLNGQLYVLYQGYPNFPMQEQIYELFDVPQDTPILYVGYSINLDTNKIKFSARSRNIKNNQFINAMDFAKFYDGGGHPDAAGFTISFEEGLSLIKNFPNFINTQ